MALDFSKLLSTPMDTVEKPKPLPTGTYMGVISKYEFGESKDKKTPYVRFFLNLTGAGPDIDVGEVAGIDWSKKQLRRDLYLTDDAIYRLKDLLASIGVPVEGRTFGESIPDALNCQVMIEVTQRNNPQDPTQIFNDVGTVRGIA
jgi:hypothetical protein